MPFACLVFQGGSEIARAMEHTSFDIISGLPEIDAYMERLKGLFFILNHFLKAINTQSCQTEYILKIFVVSLI